MKKVIILHPDLGIGGAERLILDIAIAFRKNDYETTLLTNHYDPKHCFEETKDGQLCQIKTLGNWIPRKILGNYCCALFAYARFLYLTFYIIIKQLQADLVVCDQIPIGIPFLKLFNYKVLFYCHFPDQLLTQRNSFWKKCYRFPLDHIEELSMSYADKILVNSKFTASIVEKTFTTFVAPNKELQVLYPCLSQNCTNSQNIKLNPTFLASYFSVGKEFTFLSLNRYERKKNIELAIKAFEELIKIPQLSICKDKLGLIIAGGYDERVTENLEYFAYLTKLVEDLDLKIGKDVVFLKSVSDDTKFKLLSSCSALLYTPSGEHFGIVPLEASAYGKPVIAVNDGGPRETVVNGKTGYLCEPTPSAFAAAMFKIIHPATEQENIEISLCNKKSHPIIPNDCIKHVMNNFSFQIFSQKLINIVKDITI